MPFDVLILSNDPPAMLVPDCVYYNIGGFFSHFSLKMIFHEMFKLGKNGNWEKMSKPLVPPINDVRSCTFATILEGESTSESGSM